jgi:hypothetical protein
MDTICNQIFDKIIISINDPKFRKKLNQHIINPLTRGIYQKTHNYFITIISLYGITILLLLIIISIILTKRNV